MPLGGKTGGGVMLGAFIGLLLAAPLLMLQERSQRFRMLPPTGAALLALALRTVIWPEASKAQNSVAAVSAGGSTVCILMRHEPHRPFIVTHNGACFLLRRNAGGILVWGSRRRSC